MSRQFYAPFLSWFMTSIFATTVTGLQLQEAVINTLK